MKHKLHFLKATIFAFLLITASVIAPAYCASINPVTRDSLKPSSPDNKSQSQRNEKQRDHQPPIAGSRALPLEKPIQPHRSRVDQKEAERREIENTLANKSMAKSNKEIVLWTRLQFFLAAFGTGALFYTLHLNRRATNAAIRAVEIADKMGELQTRAYISIDKAYLPISDDDIDDVLSIVVEYKNTGATPAASVRSRCGIIITKISETFATDLELAPLDPDTKFSCASIGSNQIGMNVAKSTPNYLTKNAISDIQNGACIHCIGYIEYSDVFGKNHKTNFRLYLNREVNLPLGMLMISPIGNEMT
ncbi:hypothetical protein Q1W73_09355 [Asticcacaulis sp. ZE23SCel15]|uniref:hypothetical protein n=1 Tax=Asticcacaulis sp. ZE23SCel15 TaxID=3059027 RepID=UPI00265E4F40|nr:hypothetical protein [Asticcacaulis sp. ZE23SCel15]WKL55910.1 hypothetical protein Q1W73_09355 [Asticcacaulis sp. ZE23SCel15]